MTHKSVFFKNCNERHNDKEITKNYTLKVSIQRPGHGNGLYGYLFKA